MALPFPDIDPYEVLGVEQKDAPPTIKKAYYKLCLKYHPDKLNTEEEKEKYKEIFEKIQFSYSILSDIKKRKRYDSTGSLSDGIDIENEEDIDWVEFFKEMMNNDKEITKESIESDKKSYQGSEEEEEDIIECYEYYDGDFVKLFECIPHIEIDKKDEIRLFDKVNELIKDSIIKSTKKFEKYTKNRKRDFNKLLKSVNDEAEEAELLLNEIYEKNNMKRIKGKENDENNLLALIQNKNKNNKSQFDMLLDKYSTPSKTKTKSKTKRSSEYEIDDDEFDKVQSKMLKKQRK